MTPRRMVLPFLAAATATTALLASMASRDTAPASRPAASAAASRRAVAAHVAVRLLHALTDDPDDAAAAITTTTTPALGRALLEARQHTDTPALSRMALTVTSIATDLTGTHANVRVAGQFATGSTEVGVAWILRLILGNDSRWRIEAVS